MGPPKLPKNNKRSKNRSNKIHLVFDEQKRKEFLTGFHKRKLQRKKQAKEQFEKELKEERKRIKAEAKESYKKLVVSHRSIPELDDLLKEEYEDENAKVTIVELSTDEIAKRNNWIGENRPRYSSDEEKDDETDEKPEIKEEVPGMELKQRPIKKPRNDEPTFNTEKDVKRKLKKMSTKTVQKSKVFQRKNKMEQQKQKKKSRKQMKLKEKFDKKKFKGNKRK